MNTNEPCCPPSLGSPGSASQSVGCSSGGTNSITLAIQEGYGQTARSGLSSRDANVHGVAEAFGYSADELAAIPAEANMGLSCGNPIALANLKEGEVVVDLGSGGGLDVFLASQKVGPTGRAIGIDMTLDMIVLAQRNALNGPGGKPYQNVDFKLGSIDALPLPDDSVDVIISNCVINLAPDKPAVFAEMFRVLKPGGRVAVSDIALKDGLPRELAENVAALVGCIAGAIPIEEVDAGLKAAGFREVALVDSNADLTAYAQVEGQAACCAPPTTEASDAKANRSSSALGLPVVEPGCSPSPAKALHRDLAELFERYDVNQYAASMKIFALK
ncbi:MAG: arsenite methyltransferase [Planctomycetota bacterium]